MTQIEKKNSFYSNQSFMSLLAIEILPGILNIEFSGLDFKKSLVYQEAFSNS